MGFGPAEILVVFAMASEIRPGKSEVKSSQKQLAKYANCTSRTVRRALTKMQTHGMVTKIGECNTYDLRDFFDTVLKFKETLD
jgi:DNA-binding IclR family transcriptional regulator